MDFSLDEVDKTKNKIIRRKRTSSALWLHKPKAKRQRKGNINADINIKEPSTPLNQSQNVKPNSEKLVHAPIKPRCSKKSRPKKKLFNEGPNESLIAEIVSLVPALLKSVGEAGVIFEFCQFLRLISKRKFPMNNIAFILLLDVVRWYSIDSSTQMTYKEESLRFWKVVYRLFHGKALRFLSGLKSAGQVVLGKCKRGLFNPHSSKINFAVPSRKKIVQYKPAEIQLPDEVSPGVIKEAIGMRDSKKCYVLSVDGKKCAPGLSRDRGDIDLFGFESSESLQATKDRLNDEICQIDDLNTQWKSLTDHDKVLKIQNIVLIVSKRIRDIRQLYVKQSMALKKFEKEAGSDWRNSKYVYAISSIQAFIYQMKELIHRLLEINNRLLETGSFVNGTLNDFCQTGKVDAFEHNNWVTLKNPEDLPAPCASFCSYIKQRSPEWFKLRSNFSITGSRLFEGLGFDTLKKLQNHIESLLHPEREKEPVSALAAENMAHGVRSEINAIATLVGKIMPFYFPKHKYIEEGAHIIHSSCSNKTPLILVSPDGSIGHVEISDSEIHPKRVLACEFKCPVPAIYKTPVQYSIPIRYIPQVLSEMASMDLSELIYLCWANESSTVFRISFDADLWQRMKNAAEELYLTDNLKKPSRISETTKDLKHSLEKFADQHVTFLCEVPSLFGTGSCMSQTNESSPYIFPLPTISSPSTIQQTEPIEHVFTSACSALEDVFQLCRKKATEVLVWLLSDTDRNWNPEVPHSVPVAYAMKGYSLETDSMRKMHDHILDVCASSDIDVACSCFDGQWLKLANRDKNNKPLTKIQLQRDVWDLATKTNRNIIVTELAKNSIVQDKTKDLVIERGSSGTINISCAVLANMMESYNKSLKRNVYDRLDKHEDECTRGMTNISIADNIENLPDEALEVIVNDNNLLELSVSPESLDDNNEHDDTNTSYSRHSAEEVEDKNRKLPDKDLIKILNSLQKHEKVSVSNKWKDKTLSCLKKILSDSPSMHKLTHDEMNVMITETEYVQKISGFFVRKSWKHTEKANALCKLIGSGIEIDIAKFVKKVYTLKECSSKVVLASKKEVRKNVLNSVYASFKFKEEYQKWVEERPFSAETDVKGVGMVEWFSYPEYSESRRRLEPKCVDAHHLLVNLRVKVCKDGVENIQKGAWHAVAEKDSSVISKSLVVDLVDRQSNAFALRTFSEKVENEMRKLSFEKEAEFCYLIRSWYQAEDDPGLSAIKRISRRLNLKHYLLKNVNFETFPPHGMYVKGFPKVWFESILQRIDTTIQLYALVQSGSYNQRSVSSLANETFFGELSDMEPTKLGCPKAVNIPRLISTVTELMHYRSDPSDRVFHMSTVVRPVYPKEPLLVSSQKDEENTTTKYEGSVEMVSTPLKVDYIDVKDHIFDRFQRRKKKRQSKPSDISKPNQVSRGCLPVRQHHKCDESKILATTRLGIELKDHLTT